MRSDLASPARPARLARLALAAIVIAAHSPARADGPPAAAPAAPAAPEREAEARAAFERGWALLQRGEVDAALADFERSRELHPTKGNTRNAAVCLDRLGRPDEALDRLDQLLRDFPTLTPEDRAAVATEAARLRERVGFLDVAVDEPGAHVVVDGRERGTTPLPGPLRVTAGTHAVRVVLDGHVPFEDRAVVARGQLVALRAPLAKLTRSGRLAVRAVGDVPATVVVDGVAVGAAPWEGALAPGHHAVMIVGAPPLGSPPATVDVRESEPAAITLELAPLRSALRLEPTPPTAAVALDGVTLGLGTWEGRVRSGDHDVEATSEGFLPLRRHVTVVDGASVRVPLELARDPLSPVWGRKARPRFALELSGAFAGAATGFGGDVASCTNCSAGAGLGGRALVAGAYVAPSGLRLGAEVGGMLLARRVEGRAAEIAVGPARAPSTATTSDSLRLGAVVAGLFAGFTRDDWPVELRLGAGVVLGSVSDARSATIESATVDLRQSPAARYVRIAPEIRFRHAFGDHLALHVGVTAAGLVALTTPRWSGADAPVVVPSAGSLAVFQDDRLAGGFLLVLEPNAGLGYTF
jgi:hypothetical protein